MRLHDVRDVELHVRVLLDAWLDERGAHLDATLYDLLLTYLLEKAWEISGVAGGKSTSTVMCGCGCRATIRIGWWVRSYTDVEELEDAEPEQRRWYPDEGRAWAIAEMLVDNSPGLIVSVDEGPPPSAYDPELGLSFSTYSRRTLSKRIVDWYRSTFGDTRYGPRRRTVSLDAIAERYENSGEAPEQFLSKHLNLAQADHSEEVLDRVALSG